MKTLVLAVSGIMGLTGCTTTRTLSVCQENGAMLSYVRGKPLLQSMKRNTVAVWLLTPTYKTDLADLTPPAFLVAVRNGEDQTISLSRDDITATVESRPIHILTYEEYCSEINRQTGVESLRVQKPLGQGEAPNESPEMWEPGGIMQLVEQTVDLRRDVMLRDARLMLVLDQYPIAPGHAFKGVVRLRPSDLSGGQRLRILVKTGDETHEFLYDVGS
jgi:hypothetical protein